LSARKRPFSYIGCVDVTEVFFKNASALLALGENLSSELSVVPKRQSYLDFYYELGRFRFSFFDMVSRISNQFLKNKY